MTNNEKKQMYPEQSAGLFYANKDEARQDKELLTDVFMYYLSMSEPCNKDSMSKDNRSQDVYCLFLQLNDILNGQIERL